jgi:galactokinase|tara:strand:+ start:3096 stop:4295 length:1200 start_codon:yes stop_codon:yes gene_type:complete
MLESQVDSFQRLERVFRQIYGQPSSNWIFAPGRINLIGEHVDYCGGWVLPATIHLGTYCLVSFNESSSVTLTSTLFDERVVLDLDAPFKKSADGWSNYPRGVLAAYRTRGAHLPGMDVLFGSTIPGGGLSSSASFCVATALMIESVTGFRLHARDDIDRQQMALLCQRVENEYVGVNCGIMDQAAIALGQADRAIKLDCESLRYELIDCTPSPLQFVIMNTCKERRLIDSKYNERVAEMNAIVSRLGDGHAMSQLCALGIEDLQWIENALHDELLFARARHVISENQRVLTACSMLQERNWQSLGKLMNESHISLSKDYEVAGKELDALVSLSLAQEGVLGARMTGAGFGGCAITLIHQDATEEHNAKVGELYRQRIGYAAEFYGVEIGPGAIECAPSK